ncbi:hypothetical protein [Microvirus mar12]|uniref:Uncharacterized protein n=1 Tax=Microvirus mar12 TaxID=2851144 RepID=A0A8F5RAV5_9VIRU|nr:hypothetical protein [Microvirus mar12]
MVRSLRSASEQKESRTRFDERGVQIMTDGLTFVAVIDDNNGVNAAALFGTLPFIQESFKLSLDALPEKVRDCHFSDAHVDCSMFQSVFDDEVYESLKSCCVVFTLAHFLELSEEELFGANRNLRAMRNRFLKKEGEYNNVFAR